jgi:hypothetical protein
MKLYIYLLFTLLINGCFGQDIASNFVRVEKIGFYECPFNPFMSIHIYLDEQNQNPTFWFDHREGKDSLLIPFKLDIQLGEKEVTFFVNDTTTNQKTSVSFQVTEKTDSLITMGFKESQYAKTLGIGCTRSNELYCLVIQEDTILLYFGDYLQPKNLVLSSKRY